MEDMEALAIVIRTNCAVYRGEYMFFGSIRGSEHSGTHTSTSNSNQNQIWCENIGEYMVLGSIVGSDYCI